MKTDKLFWYSSTTASENIDKFDQYIGLQPENFICDLLKDEVDSSGLMRSFITKYRWKNMPSSDPDSMWD